jgi:hypothetical protein
MHLTLEGGHKEAARHGIRGYRRMEQRDDDDGKKGDEEMSDDLTCVK